MICKANQLTGFYMMGTLVVKRLRLGKIGKLRKNNSSFLAKLLRKEIMQKYKLRN